MAQPKAVDQDDADFTTSWSQVDSAGFASRTPRSPAEDSSFTHTPTPEQRTILDGDAGFVLQSDYIRVPSSPSVKTSTNDSTFLSQALRSDTSRLEPALKRELTQLIGSLQMRLEESLKVNHDNEILVGVLQTTVEKLSDECERLRGHLSTDSPKRSSAFSTERPSAIACITVAVPHSDEGGNEDEDIKTSTKSLSSETMVDTTTTTKLLKMKRELLSEIDRFVAEQLVSGRSAHAQAADYPCLGDSYSDAILVELPMQALTRICLNHLVEVLQLSTAVKERSTSVSAEAGESTQLQMGQKTPHGHLIEDSPLCLATTPPYAAGEKSVTQGGDNVANGRKAAAGTRQTVGSKSTGNALVAMSLAFVTGFLAGGILNDMGCLNCFKGYW